MLHSRQKAMPYPVLGSWAAGFESRDLRKLGLGVVPRTVGNWNCLSLVTLFLDSGAGG